MRLFLQTIFKGIFDLLKWLLIAAGLIIGFGKIGEHFGEYLPYPTRKEFYEVKKNYESTLKEIDKNISKMDKIQKDNSKKQFHIDSLEAKNKAIEERRKRNRALLDSIKGDISKLDSLASEIL